MNKKDLKNYSIVETREGEQYIKLDGCFVKLPTVTDIELKRITYLDLTYYNDDLTHQRANYWDIMKINGSENFTIGGGKRAVRAFKTLIEGCHVWTWVREENILTDKERDYLRNVIEPVKDKVNYIFKKDNGNEKYYVSIRLNNDDFMVLYSFAKDMEYKGMKLDKEYTLKKLGLE